MQNSNGLSHIIDKYLAGTATDREIKILLTWLDEGVDETDVIIESDQEDTYEWTKERIRKTVEMRLAQIGTHPFESGTAPVKTAVRKVRPVRKWMAAAAVIGGALLGAYLLWTSGILQGKADHNKLTARADVAAPQSNRARITLDNGTVIYLDSLGKGNVGGLLLEGSGELVYASGATSATQLVYHTLSNPKGSTVLPIQLSDGTKVWLNAGSEMRYPVHFLPGSRTVMIDGEAFFEVAHDPVRPFYVEKSGTTIRVLGTRFNMEAYEGFSLKTSLLEGAVRVIKGKDSIEIKPGQQAEVDKVIHLNRNVDMEKVTAWKAGFFNFDGDGLREVMQQLESWYDIEVVYRGNIPEVEFYGKLHRTTSLGGVLKALQLSNIRYTITSNKKLILEP